METAFHRINSDSPAERAGASGADDSMVDLLRRFAAGVEAESGALVKRHFPTGTCQLATWGCAAAALDEYRNHCTMLERPGRAARHRGGFVAIDCQLDPDYPQATAKISYLRRHNIRHILEASWLAAEDTHYRLSFQRGTNAKPFSAEDVRFGNYLLAGWLDEQATFEAGSDRQSGGTAGSHEEILDRLDQAVMLIDEALRVRFANRMAVRQFTAEARLRITAGQLEAADALERRVLEKAVKRAIAGTSTTPISIAGAGEHFLLLVTPFVADGQPLALVFARCCRGTGRVPNDHFAKAYRLTSAETRLASELGRGERVEDFALAHGISIATARTHLRSLFQKTDSLRQADLVRLVACFPNAIT